MADVFVSYKRQDEVAVGRLVKALRGEGLSVWWDRDIPPGAPWEDTIEREHEQSRSLVVCWSKAAVASENVKAEARRSRSRNQLVQTYMEPCEPPMFFGERQGVDLSGWTGKPDDPRFKAVLEAVRAVLDGREADHGVGAAAPEKASRRGVVIGGAASLAAVVAIGAGAVMLMGHKPPAVKPPTPPPAVSAVDRVLNGVAGQWGVENRCERRYIYAVARAGGETHIKVEGKGFHSEGRVVSVSNGVILSEALSPAGDRGNLVEIRPEATQLVLQDRRTDTRQVLVKCG